MQERILIWANYTILYMLKMRSQTHKSFRTMLFLLIQVIIKLRLQQKKLEFEKGKHKKRSNNEEKIEFYISSEIRHRMTLQEIKFYII